MRPQAAYAASMQLGSPHLATQLYVMQRLTLYASPVLFTHATSVGKEEAKSSVTMAPEADQVKISIWPGVSSTMCSKGGSRFFSQSWMT